MKKLNKLSYNFTLLVMLTGSALNTYASGLYLGVDSGYGTINTSTTNGYRFTNNTTSQSSGNILAGLIAGFDFNNYIGLELAYNYIASSQYAIGENSSSNFNVNQQIYDLGITGHFPLGLLGKSLNNFSLFGKAGIGYSNTSFSGGYTINRPYSNIVAFPGSSSNFVPVFAAGLEYDIGQIGIQAGYKYAGSNTISNGSQNIATTSNNLYTISLLYHF